MKYFKEKKYILTFFVVVLFLVLTAIGFTKSFESRLYRGQFLNKGDRIVSENRLYHLHLKDDCNLIMSRVPDPADVDDWVNWQSNTRGNNCRLQVQQSDGNIVLYVDGVAKWATNKFLGKNYDFIEMANNGDIIAGSFIFEE